MSETDNPYTQIYQELYAEAQSKLPERCRGCGHVAVGLMNISNDIVSGEVTREQATYEIDVAIEETASKCTLGRVESVNIPGSFMCSYEIDAKKVETNQSTDE